MAALDHGRIDAYVTYQRVWLRKAIAFRNEHPDRKPTEEELRIRTMEALLEAGLAEADYRRLTELMGDTILKRVAARAVNWDEVERMEREARIAAPPADGDEAEEDPDEVASKALAMREGMRKSVAAAKALREEARTLRAARAKHGDAVVDELLTREDELVEVFEENHRAVLEGRV